MIQKCYVVRSFNSILVRLKASAKAFPTSRSDLCFNSILVRLKGDFTSALLETIQFQFHTGSIKSLAPNAITPSRTI